MYPFQFFKLTVFTQCIQCIILHFSQKLQFNIILEIGKTVSVSLVTSMPAHYWLVLLIAAYTHTYCYAAAAFALPCLCYCYSRWYCMIARFLFYYFASCLHSFLQNRKIHNLTKCRRLGHIITHHTTIIIARSHTINNTACSSLKNV